MDLENYERVTGILAGVIFSLVFWLALWFIIPAWW
jgi:hypothetical protein